ncbi:MAG: Dabb family protein [Bryobacteraceae bacterium]|nr:Dabb family protein [Bryobacteraceae bacterium]
MTRILHWKTGVAVAAALAIFGAGALIGAAGKPKSVIHVVTVKWKPGTTPDQIKAALDGVHKLGEAYPGIKNVWTRSIKVQGPESGVTHAFVMEFESEQALKDYADSSAQKEWYKVYVPIRDQSRTFDITN